MTLLPRCLFLVLLPACWADFARIPLHFEANRGQFRKPARFVADGVLLAAAEAQFLLGADRIVLMRVDGGNPAAAMDGIDKLPGESNYFLGGDPQHWRTHVPHFARVRVEKVYPGIDLIYYGKDRQLEFDFVVAPGADPRVIRLAFDGATPRLDDAGDLLLDTIRLQKPYIYQEIDGVRRTVEGRFRIDSENRAGFAVSPYDVSRPLIIDPVLNYSTLLTSSSSVGDGIAIDAAGNTYLTGNANSGFLTVSGLQPAFGAALFDVSGRQRHRERRGAHHTRPANRR